MFAHIVYAWMYIYVWRSLLAPNSYVDVVRRDSMAQSEYLQCTYVAVGALTLLPPATPMLDNILPGNQICVTPSLSRVLPTRTRALQEMPHSRREVRYESRDLSHYGEGVKGVRAHETKTWGVSVSRVLILPSARHASPG